MTLASAMPTAFRLEQQGGATDVYKELAALFAQPNPEIFAEHKKNAGIIYGQTVSAFVEACVDPQLKHAPPAPGQVLQDLREIWLQNGFIPPHELKLKLMKRYAPDLPPVAFDTMQELLVSRYNDLEPLTGFQRKQHAPITTGLAHLYAILTDRPVTMVEFDFLNMGGTNEFRRKLIAGARGVPVTDVDEREAWSFTDQAARVIAGISREAMQVGARDLGVTDAKIQGFRTGGDEMRLVCVGLTQEQCDQIIRDYVQPAIERFTAEAGLHDHEHGKARDDDWRRGFGAVCATIALDLNTQPGHELEQVDQRIAANKLAMGVRRRGALPPAPGVETGALPPPAAVSAFENHLSPELRELLQLARKAGLEDDEEESGDDEEGKEEKAGTSLQYATLSPGAEDESTLDPAKAGRKRAGGGRRKKKTRLQKQSRQELEKRLGGLGIKRDLSKTPDGELRDLVQATVADKLQNNIQRHAAEYTALKQRCGTLYAPERSFSGKPSEFRSTQGFAMTADRASALLNASSLVLQNRYGRFLTPLAAPPRPFPDITLPPTLFRTPIERDTQLMHAALDKRGASLDPAQRKLFERMLASSSPIDSATRTYVGDVMPEIFGQFAKDAGKLREHLRDNPELLAKLQNPNLADLKARAMAVSMENLGGINKLLGHDNANIVLHHFAQKIVLDSFAATGVKLGRENVEIGHDGGGRMLLAIRPIVSSAEGARVLSDQDIKTAQAEIDRRMQDFRNANVSRFLEQAGGTLPKGLDRLMTMAEIADGKGRAELRGMDVVSTVMPLEHKNAHGKVIRGGENKDALITKIETEISAKRADALERYTQDEQRRNANGQGTRQTHQTVQWNPLLGEGQNHPSGGDGGNSPESGQRRDSRSVQRPGGAGL